MFTLRFMNGNKVNQTVVSAVRYDTRDNLYPDQVKAQSSTVTIYPQFTSEAGGVEFQVGGEHNLAYGVCWVENQAGKTIDRIGPFEPSN